MLVSRWNPASVVVTQDISKVKPDQLRSLCGLHVSPSPELLSQIAAIGQGLTSLTLSTEGASTGKAHCIKVVT